MDLSKCKSIPELLEKAREDEVQLEKHDETLIEQMDKHTKNNEEIIPD